jgi:hypothetical protein
MVHVGWEFLLPIILLFCSASAFHSFRFLHPYCTTVRHHDTNGKQRIVGLLEQTLHQSSSSSSSGDVTTTLNPTHNTQIPVAAVVPPLRFEIRLDVDNDDDGGGASKDSTTHSDEEDSSSSNSSSTTTPTTMKYDDDDDDGDCSRILTIELTCSEDIEKTVERTRYRLQSSQEREGLIQLLTEYWTQHVQYCYEMQMGQTTASSDNINEPIVYLGPTPSATIEDYETTVVAKIDIPINNNGLVLRIEVADSTIPNAGKGIFVRALRTEADDDDNNHNYHNTDSDSSKNIIVQGDTGILQTIGSAFCGYGRGKFVPSLDDGSSSTTTLGDETTTPFSNGMKERAFEFRLEQGKQSTVWYDGQLMSIGEAIQKSSATHVACHTVTFDDNNGGYDENNNNCNDEEPCCYKQDLLDVQPTDIDDSHTDQYNTYRYFVPLEEQPDFSTLSIQTLGQMANDLAGGRCTRVGSPSSIDSNDISSSPRILNDALRTEEEYYQLSTARNILVLIPRIELEIRTEIDPPDDESTPQSDPRNLPKCTRRVLKPSGMPVMTLSRSVAITNTNIPMEVGCQYGYHYWSSP